MNKHFYSINGAFIDHLIASKGYWQGHFILKKNTRQKEKSIILLQLRVLMKKTINQLKGSIITWICWLFVNFYHLSLVGSNLFVGYSPPTRMLMTLVVSCTSRHFLDLLHVSWLHRQINWSPRCPDLSLEIFLMQISLWNYCF